MPCDSGNTASLTITGDQTSGYQVSPDPVTIPVNGCIAVTAPAGGCVLCLNNSFDGKGKRIPLDAGLRTFGPISEAAGTKWTYTVQGPGTDPCPTSNVMGVGHTIQVGSSGTL